MRVDGLIWTKFSDPVDIFTRDGTKNHSVELTDMACGPADKNGNVPVGSFKFDGCCILSTTDPSIKPAMTGSCVTANFSVEDITAQIRDRLYEYQAIQQNYTAQNDNPSDEEKGDTTPMNENEKNPAMTENAVAEGAVENPEIETPAAENTATKTESEAAPAENAAPEEGAENATTEVPAENTAPAEEGEPVASSEFTLTTEQLLNEISGALGAYKIPSSWDPENMVPRYWMNDVQGDEVIVIDCTTYNLMGIPYSMNGDNVVLDVENAKRKKVTFEDWDEGEVLPGMSAAFTEITNTVAEMNAKISDLTKEFTEASETIAEMKPKLEAYEKAEADAKAAEMEAKRNALFTTFDEKLGADAEYIALKENKEISYSDLETKCYALVGRKSAEFSYVPNKNNKGTVRFGVGGTQNGSDVAYGGLIEHYLGNK